MWKEINHAYIKLIFLAVLLTEGNYAELVVNVKNQGGEVYQESISANVTEDTIQLSFDQPDGTSVYQLIDVKNEIQITNMIVLGEEELREVPYRALCFVTSFNKSDFIPPDAMAKLRQKNPWTVRIPEKDMGKENITLNVLLDISSTDWISPHIRISCADAADGTYARKEELTSLIAAKTASGHEGQANSVEASELFLRTVKPFPLADDTCWSIRDFNKACRCDIDLCVGWYPCALKYCRTHDAAGKSISHRCGIHTCKACRKYTFSVPRKYACTMSS